MPEELIGLNESQVDRIGRVLEYVEADFIPQPRQGTRRPPQASRIVIGALTSAALATTGLLTKPKVATLNIYTFTSTGVEDTGLDEKCYNFAPAAATTDRWTVCERCSITGKLIITSQFCS